LPTLSNSESIGAVGEARLPAPPPPAPLLTLVAGDLAHPASHDVRTYWDACALRRLPERLQLYLAALTEEYEPVMLFLNHSCEPNGGFGGNVLLVAMSDIEAVPPRVPVARGRLLPLVARHSARNRRRRRRFELSHQILELTQAIHAGHGGAAGR